MHPLVGPVFSTAQPAEWEAAAVLGAGPWRVWRGDEASEVAVGESAVLRGDTVRLGAAAQIPPR